MISAQQFLNLLEERRLVPTKALKSLRRQVAASTQPVPASRLAWLLIENGYLDRATAQDALGEPLPEAPPPSRGPRWPRPGASRADQRPDEGDLGLAPLDEAGEEEYLPADEGEMPLGLAPLESEAEEDELLPLDDLPVPSGPTRTFASPPLSSDEADLIPLDESEDELVPIDEPPRVSKTPKPPLTPGPSRPVQSPEAKDAPPSSISDALDAMAPAGGPARSATSASGPGGMAAGPAGRDLLSDAAMAEAAGGVLEPAGPPRQSMVKRWFRRRGSRRSDRRWDSGTFLIAGGALLALLLAGAGLAWLLTQESAEERLGIADRFYDEGSYTQAIANYDAFLQKFPKHSGASLARVRRGLCQMRQTTGNASRDWVRPLETARSVLGEIATEPEFKQAWSELAAILPTIAEGLAHQAQEKTDPKLVEQSRTAIAMVDKYVPKSLRPTVRLADVEASLALTEREIARGSELDRAVAGIQKAIAEQTTARAYAIRSQLLKQYPDLATHEKLSAAILAVSQAEKAAVKRVAKEQAASTAAPPSAALATLALAHSTVSGTAPGAEGHVVFAAQRGTVYALDAANGDLLWRRFLGLDPEAWRTAPLPIPVSSQPGADVLVVASAAQELWRVQARTGEVVWRFPVGEAFHAWPILEGTEALLPTDSGRIVRIDVETGASPGFIQLGQPLRVEPAIDPVQGLLFQLADHSNLYVLSRSDKTCREVCYLGHEGGTILTPPAVISRYLILAENTGLETATLRVFGIGTEEGKTLAPLQQIRVQGNVDTAIVVASPRVLVTTDQGRIYLFEIRGEDPKQPVHQVAETALEGGAQLARFPLAGQGAFWVADRQLTKFDIQASRGRLVPQWIRDEHAAYVQPLAAVGEVVYHARTPDGLRGLVMAASDMAEGAKLWETFLAAPLVAAPRVESGGASLTAVASSGAVFRPTADQIQGHSVMKAAVAAWTPAELTRAVEGGTVTSEGAMALSSGRDAQRVAILFRGDTGRFRWLNVPDPAASLPACLGQGVLVPTLSGLVYWLDPQTNQKLSEPFQPQLSGPQPVAWTRPQAVGADRFVIGDGDRRVFLVGVQAEPKPHLAALAQRELPDRLAAGPVVAGETVYVLDAGATLSAFALADLADRKQQRLSGRCVWGPCAAGDRLLLATSDSKLICIGADQETAWQAELPYGPPVGEPLVADGNFVFAAARGTVWRLDGASGKELGKVEAGEPLGTGPVAWRKGLLVGSQDGTVLEVAAP